MMNRTQKIIAIIGITLILLMSVFPPWKLTTTGESYYREIPRGYYPIFAPPPPDAPLEDEESVYSLVLDFTRLSVQWVTALLVLAAVLYLTRNRVEPLDDDDENAEVIF
jgi:hypothetical protein